MKLVSTCMCFGSHIEVSITFVVSPISSHISNLFSRSMMNDYYCFICVYRQFSHFSCWFSITVHFLTDDIDLDIMIVSSAYAVELSTVVPADGSRLMCNMACGSIVLPCGAFWKKTGTLDSVGHNCITSNTERHWILYNIRWPDDLWSYGLIEILSQFLLEGLRKPMEHLSVLTELHKHA